MGISPSTDGIISALELKDVTYFQSVFTQNISFDSSHCLLRGEVLLPPLYLPG